MIAPAFFVPVSVDAMATDLPRVPAGKLAGMWMWDPNSIRVLKGNRSVSQYPVF
ncbi:MAG: hypothetical protein VYC80_12170 [Planctomycetota bacterium]|nr:hypothetical protein [Planctomycetota bacterium]MEC7497341.1 hypothetical protein [Planctomycetota bacterium]MED5284594.1 hypothetical protein [Planctomycetota bacterium]